MILVRRSAATIALALLPLCTTSARQPCPPEENPGTVTDFGRRFESGRVFEPTLEVPGTSIDPPGESVKYVRAQVSLRRAPRNGWHLTVRDAKYHVVQTLTADDFTGTTPRWTPRVYSPTLWLDFQPGPSSTGRDDVAFVIERYQVMRDTNRSYYSQQGPTVNFRPLYALGDARPFEPEYLRLGDVTGLLMGGSTDDAWACTVVAVAPDMVLTNWHCGGPGERMSAARFWKEDICPSTVIDMSWDDDNVSQEFRCATVVAHEALDIALLTVTPAAGARLRPARIRLTPPANRRVTVVHHPAGDRKQIGINCEVVSWDETVDGRRHFTHKCDTHPGSSGAPIFNANQELIGLHRKGFDFSTATCGYTDKVNKAIHMSDIVAFLRTNHKALADKLTVFP